METWEIVLTGIAAALITMWFLPGIRSQLQQQRENADQPKDWKGALMPLVFVALFVALLLSLV